MKVQCVFSWKCRLNLQQWREQQQQQQITDKNKNCIWLPGKWGKDRKQEISGRGKGLVGKAGEPACWRERQSQLCCRGKRILKHSAQRAAAELKKNNGFLLFLVFRNTRPRTGFPIRGYATDNMRSFCPRICIYVSSAIDSCPGRKEGSELFFARKSVSGKR